MENANGVKIDIVDLCSGDRAAQSAWPEGETRLRRVRTEETGSIFTVFGEPEESRVGHDLLSRHLITLACVGRNL